jgi:hypothetical protein
MVHYNSPIGLMGELCAGVCMQDLYNSLPYVYVISRIQIWQVLA